MIGDDKKVSLIGVIKQTLGSLLYPQVVFIFLIPLVVSILLVAAAFWLSWDFWYALLQQTINFVNPSWQNFLSYLPVFLADALSSLGPLTTFILIIFLLAVGFPFVVVLNLAITSIIASTYLVHFIARRDFSNLEKKGSAQFVAGIWNTISSSVLFVFFWFITLPLWLVPGAQLVLPTLLTAWLNRRVCLFDALAEFGSTSEIALIKQQYSGQAYVLGLITTVFNFLPFAIIFSPVLAMISFTYFGLSALHKNRLPV